MFWASVRSIDRTAARVHSRAIGFDVDCQSVSLSEPNHHTADSQPGFKPSPNGYGTRTAGHMTATTSWQNRATGGDRGGARMPKVMLYVSDADAAIWERARDLAGDGDSLSAIVSRALAAYVEQREREQRAEDSLQNSMREYLLLHESDDDTPRKFRFTGALIHTSSEGHGRITRVYLTKARRIVVEAENRSGNSRVDVYDGFEDFAENSRTQDPAVDRDEYAKAMLVDVSEALGREWVEDIG
jgi:hypothetical protein